MAQLLQPKQQLAGYEIGELVGKGGMGEVYRARQISMDRVVALKILAPRLAKQDPIFAKRFVDEARAAGRLNHPNIIAVHDVGKAPMPGSAAGTEPDLDYFSMEYVDGESVKDVIERQGICPLSLVAQVMQGMTEAMVYAEAQGIVHRDIKPDNIMITNGGVVKLADLGLALQLGGEEIVGEKDGQGRSKVMGTPLYMSPEQARALPVDSRSDQYSLGATLFHMLTGKPPFKGDNAKVIMRSHVFDPVPDPKELNSEVPEGWRQLAMRLLAKTPEERFSNAPAMRTAVQAAISGNSNPGISRRVRTNGFANAKERAASMPPWAKYLVYGFAAAVVLMVVVFSIPWGGSKKETKPTEPVVVQPDPQEEARKLLDRVKTRISALPGDHQKAIAMLDQMVEDKTIPVGPARDLIEREKAARSTAYNDQKRKEDERILAEKNKERQAKFIELEQVWAANDLVKTRECMDYLTKEADKLTPSARERLTAIKAKYGVALVDQQKNLTDQVGQAQTIDELKALAAKVDTSALADDTKTTIKTQILKRVQELAPLKPAQPADDRAQWQALAGHLDELRGELSSYGKIQPLVQKESSTFVNPDSRAKVLTLAQLGRLAAKAEGALRGYVASVNPTVDIMVGSKPSKAKLRAIDERVSFVVQDGSGDLETKHDRKSVALPLRQLLEAALQDHETTGADRTAMMGAMLWYWRAPDASAVFASIPDHELAKAVLELEQKTRVLDLQGKIVRAGDQATVIYDGTKNPWFLGDFVGDGAQLAPQGLAWSTKIVANPKGPESGIPTLKWKQALRPPFALTAQFMLQPKTHLLLFGVTSGERTVRIGFNNTRSQHSAVALVTKADGSGFELPRTISWTGQFKLDAPQKVEVRVDADYRVTLRFNDNKLTDMLELPAGGTIVPVLQAVLLEEGNQTATVLTSLSISGTLVSAE